MYWHAVIQDLMSRSSEDLSESVPFFGNSVYTGGEVDNNTRSFRVTAFYNSGAVQVSLLTVWRHLKVAIPTSHRSQGDEVLHTHRRDSCVR